MSEKQYRVEPFFYSEVPLDPDEDPNEPYCWELQESTDGKHWRPTGKAFEDESEAKDWERKLNYNND